MIQKNKVAIVGYGNIGKYAIKAVEAAPDFVIGGLVRSSGANKLQETKHLNIPVVNNIKDLTDIKVALLCLPTRLVPQTAAEILALGINTVDSYDIHGQLADYRIKSDLIAKKHNSVSIISAGWDPGTDSMVRCMFEFMAPQGITYTNFGPGMSMGHSVAARAIEGVKNALSMTMPQGAGIHKRVVYVEMESGQTLEDITARLKADDYFAHDDTKVIAVEDINTLIDMGHGVSMQRKGVSSSTHNQLMNLQMSINNPALTAQIMLASARATLRQKPGAYTMIEVPIIDYLPGDRDQIIRKLV
ncbi:MAG TPA: diaminopimelate dehydrogenase [Syntrophomonadaceae bacterium]|nr:diaminopimelate dehydrogenase [Syntrophomonadaceae bacterium]HPR94476.1 diaminopimelate dehydrogenase [Syntrophomonadaceae bacterium]